MSLRSNNISISLLADTFNQTEADIMRALRYWDSLDVISLSFNGPGNSLSNIVLRDIKHTGQAANAMADPIAAESASVNSTSSYQTETVRAAKPLSAGEIAKQFDMTQATVSYHLKVLKKADLIRENRKKNFIYYELNLTVLEELMMWLSDLKNKEN